MSGECSQHMLTTSKGEIKQLLSRNFRACPLQFTLKIKKQKNTENACNQVGRYPPFLISKQHMIPQAPLKKKDLVNV